MIDSLTPHRLDTVLAPKGLMALTPALAVDQNTFAVTQATADRLRIRRLSDVTPVAGQLTLGGPPECPTRPFCAKGLEDKYGIRFKAFKALDAGGPLTKTALRNGDIDVGLLFTSDAKGFVLLEDDRKLQNADAVLPVIKTDKVNDEARTVMNNVSAKLTTEALSDLNERVGVNKEDPDAVAQAWLTQNGFGKK
jgi:osmoprotectant transport system substrate-binding protein